MHPDASRLFALDESLRAEADQMLADSGIGAILDEAGYVAVGSYALHTMTWRDIDFERYEDEPDWSRHWEVGTRLAKTGWCVRMNCVDWFRLKPEDTVEHLYWGIRIVSPCQQQPIPLSHPTVWKLDLWVVERNRFAANARRRDGWLRRLDDEARSYVLAIKEAVCDDPEYRRTMLSVHIYDAVLSHNIRDPATFRAWWKREHGSQA